MRWVSSSMSSGSKVCATVVLVAVPWILFTLLGVGIRIRPRFPILHGVEKRGVSARRTGSTEAMGTVAMGTDGVFNNKIGNVLGDNELNVYISGDGKILLSELQYKLLCCLKVAVVLETPLSCV
jgi:hypothetical protein